ncbi:MAG: hypothetical protein AAFW81_07605 [Pseudomonadota bacterium]
MALKLGTLALATGATMLIGCASAPPAQASGWRFVPSRCPDLVEDYYDRRESRRDERRDYSAADVREDRRDRRESRRDEAVTVCPASAWVWDGPRRYRPARPAAAAVYYDARARHYYRYGPDRVRLTIVF